MPDPIGWAWLVAGLKQPLITALDVAILKPSGGRVADYLSLFLNSPETLQHAETVATGTTRKRVTRSVLSQFELVWPCNDVVRRRNWR